MSVTSAVIAQAIEIAMAGAEMTAEIETSAKVAVKTIVANGITGRHVTPRRLIVQPLAVSPDAMIKIRHAPRHRLSQNQISARINDATTGRAKIVRTALHKRPPKRRFKMRSRSLMPTPLRWQRPLIRNDRAVAAAAVVQATDAKKARTQPRNLLPSHPRKYRQ